MMSLKQWERGEDTIIDPGGRVPMTGMNFVRGEGPEGNK